MSATLLRAPAAERIPRAGRLAIRALRYAGDGQPPALPPVEGLVVRVRGAAERPVWHAATGLYGFLHVHPGPAAIVITDPGRRRLSWVVSAVIPDREAVEAAIAAGTPPPAIPPLVLDLALRPTSEGPLPPGTSIHGAVREPDGTPAPLARLAVETVSGAGAASVTTWADDRGTFLLPLPGERVAATRRLVVHAPRPPLAAALRRDFLAALPADLDAMDPDAAAAPFVRRHFRLVAPDGTVLDPVTGEDPLLPVTPGAARRDIELLP